MFVPHIRLWAKEVFVIAIPFLGTILSTIALVKDLESAKFSEFILKKDILFHLSWYSNRIYCFIN